MNIDFDTIIDDLYYSSKKDERITLDFENGDKVTIEIDRNNNDVDTDTMIGYLFISLILIVILLFFVGLVFKNFNKKNDNVDIDYN